MAYAAAATLQRLLAFLLIPVYARALDPAEYGQLAIILTVSAGLQTVLSFGLETAIFREYVRLAAEPRQRELYVNSVGLFALIVPVVAAAVIGVGWWTAEPQAVPIPPQALLVALLAGAIQQAAIVVPMAILRAQERLTPYVRATAMYALSSAVLTVAAVVVFDLGVMGWLAASLVSSVIFLAIALPAIDHRWTTVVSRVLLFQALGFGLPLLFHALAHWALGLSDRLILAANVDESSVGVYGLAYQLTSVVSILAVALNQAVMPLYARASLDDADAAGLRDVVTRQALTVAFLGVTVALLGPLFVVVALPSSYADAASLIPPIALGFTLFGWYLIPMDTIILIVGRTRSIFVCTVTAATANVVLNLILVPTFGAMAAAVNTAIGYGILLGLVLLYARRLAKPRFRYNWRAIGLGVAVTAATYFLSATLAPAANSLAASAIRVGLLAVAGGLLLVIAIGRSPASARAS